MTFRSGAYALLLLLLAPGAAASQATVHVPLTDPAYLDVERLLALVGGGPVVMGQRPWSEATFALLVDSLEERLGEEVESGSPAHRGGSRILGRLRRRFGELGAGGRVGLREVRVDGTWTDSPARRTPPNLEWIEDRTNPLVAYRQGRSVVRGATLGVEVAGSARPTDFLAAYVRPRARAAFASQGAVALGDEARALILPSSDGKDVVAQSLYGRIVLGRLSLVAGRRSAFWGQGPRDGLLISLNPRPFDMVEVSTERPFRMPWLLGVLGPVHGTVFLADLGREDQRFPGSKLVGVKLSARPHPSLEVGIATLNEQGGEGAPEAGLGERILDVLILPDLLRAGSDFLFSEKL
ncbi:MAG: capsule assembly Wzi family protein, partial [Gemmatimonadota bacterium]